MNIYHDGIYLYESKHSFIEMGGNGSSPVLFVLNEFALNNVPKVERLQINYHKYFVLHSEKRAKKQN